MGFRTEERSLKGANMEECLGACVGVTPMPVPALILFFFCLFFFGAIVFFLCNLTDTKRDAFELKHLRTRCD